MYKYRWLLIFLIAVVVMGSFSAISCRADEKVGVETDLSGQKASEGSAPDLGAALDVQKYNRAIHVMAMLLVGFGFLMVFVKKYGRSAVTATYLLVSVAIALYILINSLGIFGGTKIEADMLIFWRNLPQPVF